MRAAAGKRGAGREATPVFARPWAPLLGRAPGPGFFAEVDGLFAEEIPHFLAPLPAAPAALNALAAAGLPLGLATNDSEAGARAQVRLLSLEALPPFIAGYDSGHGAKPEPGMILAFARCAGIAPEEVALVGDSLRDMRAAKAAGAMTIAVLTGIAGAAARKELAPEADAVIPSLSDLGTTIGIPAAA